jgi:carboxymethylenebutenolidase
MTLRDYLAEEIVLDCQDGLITRREALRRFALLGIGAIAATPLLAACGDGGDEPAQPAGPTTTRQIGGQAELITFPGPRGRLEGAWAEAPSAVGAVLVIHENRGLTPHIRSIPPRLAGDGYSALAIDLLSEEGGTAKVGGEAEAMAALAAAPEQRLIADLRAGLDEVARRTRGAKLAVIGFCYGGGLTWRLLNAGEPRLAAAVPFYGPVPDRPDFSRSKAAVLAIYAEQDARVNATRDRALSALRAAGLVHEARTFPGADHAFFNDTGPRYNPRAAAEAYEAVLAWFRRHLA